MAVFLIKDTYYCKFRHQGRQIKRSCNTADKEEAERFEQQLRDEFLAGGTVPEPGQKPSAELSLSGALERLWEEEWQYLRDGQAQHNRILWVASQFDDPRLADIDDAFLERVKRKLRSRGRDTATVNRYIAHLRKILRTAKLAWRVPLELPMFRLGKEKGGRTRTVSPEEEAAMLKVLRGSVDGESTMGKTKGNFADLFEVIIETGMRLSEPLSITWDHVNFADKLLTLTPEITKASKPRTIPLSNRAFQILSRRQKQGFATPFPFGRQEAEYAWRYARKRCGIVDSQFCWHSLRHTFATRLLVNGVDLYTVSKLLGHSSITVTERYAHMCVAKLRGAVDTLNGGE